MMALQDLLDTTIEPPDVEALGGTIQSASAERLAAVGRRQGVKTHCARSVARSRKQ